MMKITANICKVNTVKKKSLDLWSYSKKIKQMLFVDVISCWSNIYSVLSTCELLYFPVILLNIFNLIKL